MRIQYLREGERLNMCATNAEKREQIRCSEEFMKDAKQLRKSVRDKSGKYFGDFYSLSTKKKRLDARRRVDRMRKEERKENAKLLRKSQRVSDKVKLEYENISDGYDVTV